MTFKQFTNTLEHLWKPVLAFAFILIILFDFIIAPSIVLGMIKAGIHVAMWTPLTMDGAGTFYISIGVILGATTWQSGRATIERVKKGYDFGNSDSENNIDPGPPL